MNFINKIKDEVRFKERKIILTEGNDERVLQAAYDAKKDNLAKIIIIGNKDEIMSFALLKNIDLTDIEIINPNDYSKLEELTNDLYQLRKEKGLSIEEAKGLLLTDYMYFACMLVYKGYADGIVSGADHSTADTLRPALQILRNKQEKACSFCFLEVPNCNYGLNGLFVFADCGLIQNPTSDVLADIAIAASYEFENFTGEKAYTALLSHSTMGSAKHDDVTKIQEAFRFVKEKNSNFLIDGELQLDAAIDPDVAIKKAPNSLVAGKANVLVFPDLDAANIGSKLVQRFAAAELYGPITHGLLKPVNDLSRGCFVEDIVGLIAITAFQVK